jgi:hypothetical protein
MASVRAELIGNFCPVARREVGVVKSLNNSLKLVSGGSSWSFLPKVSPPVSETGYLQDSIFGVSKPFTELLNLRLSFSFSKDCIVPFYSLKIPLLVFFDISMSSKTSSLSSVSREHSNLRSLIIALCSDFVSGCFPAEL